MAADYQNVVAQISSIVAEMKGRPSAVVPADFDEVDLIKVGKFDSLDFVNLLFRLEESHEIRIPEKDIDAYRLTIVRNLARYIVEAKK